MVLALRREVELNGEHGKASMFFTRGFFERPTLQDDFVLIKIGSQIALTSKKDPIKPF